MADRTVKSVDEDLGELVKEVSAMRADFAGFRGRVETELGLFRGVAKGIADKLMALFAAIVIGMAGVIGGAFWVGWQVGSVISEVKQNGNDVKDLKSEVKQQGGRLDGMARQLDTLIRQTAPAPKAGG
jgi:hypothetical protein